MRLLSVSTGKVQTVQIGSEVVRTGHIKAPLAEPWLITNDGVEGDERAVHPDKLYAFARTAYDYWGETLGIAPHRWPDGFFGENLTFDRLDERDLRIGDLFSLGDKVRLFVAGARNPCNKLSWRLAQPPTFQKRFAKSANAGIYFGVAQGGRVRPGDQLKRIAHNSTMPSVAEVSAYIIDTEPPPIESLSRVLAFDQLSSTNRLLLSAKVEAAQRATDVAEGRWQGWRAFRVEAVKTEAPDIRSVTLMPVDCGPLPRPKPGQFVTVKLDDKEGGSVQRNWSLSSFAFEPQHYRLTVRRQEGRGSRLFHALSEGDSVALRAPAGEFFLDTGSFRPTVLIAAGIGITPLKAMLDAHLARSDAPAIHLIYGGRDACSLAFRDELEALAGARDDLGLTLVYSRDAAAAKRGRLNAELIVAELAGLSVVVGGHRHTLPWFEAFMYICGPVELCESLKIALVAKGANADRILFERFDAISAEPASVHAARVSFERSGIEAHWRLEDDVSLLELAERAGVTIASSCRSGTCMTCRSTLLAGDATGALGDGTILPCIARPKTPALILDI